MALEIRIEMKDAKVNVNDVMNAVRGDRLGRFAATEWMRLYRSYMPYEPRSTEINAWEIVHGEPYAHYDYEGNVRGPNVPINGGEAWFSPKVPKTLTGKKLVFSHGSDHWDQKAIPTQRENLISALQAFIDGGGIL